jgi:hypothetical protein
MKRERAMMKAWAICGLVAWLLAVACHPDAGERCNPLLFSDECHGDNSNIYCTVPANCAVAYCCAVDTVGDAGIIDKAANCQPCAGPDMAVSDLGAFDAKVPTD